MRHYQFLNNPVSSSLKIALPSLLAASTLFADPVRDQPSIAIDPQEIICETAPGGRVTRSIEVGNIGDELLEYETRISVLADPSVEDVEHLRVLIVIADPDGRGRHTMLDGALEAGVLRENILEIAPANLHEIDPDDWDVMVFTDGNDYLFYHNYQYNKAIIDDWIADGGILVMACRTSTHNPTPLILPGGVHYEIGASTHAVTNLLHDGVEGTNPLIHGRVDDREDDSPGAITGHNANDGGFQRPYILENDEIANPQILYYQQFMGDGGPDRWVTLATWDYGLGHVCATTINVTGFYYEDWMENGPRWLARNFYLWADWVGREAWLQIDPAAGEIEAGEAIEVSVNFNAALILSGSYTAGLNFSSNDPLHGNAEVNIEMTVTDSPDIEVTWSAAIGYPEILDYNLNFQELWQDQEYIIPIVIRNLGVVDLNVENIRFDGAGAEYFSLVEEEVRPIGRRNSSTVNIRFSPEEAMEYNPTLLIESDDPDEQLVEIPLHAVVTTNPSLSLDPESFAAQLIGGEDSTCALTIGNTGGGTLRFEIAAEISPDPQQHRREVRNANNGIVPRRDDPGDVLEEFIIPNGIIEQPGQMGFIFQNMAWDEDRNWMWIANNLSGTFYAVDPSDEFSSKDWFGGVNVPVEQTWDIAYHNSIIYAQTSNRNFYLMCFDVDGNRLDDLIPEDLDRDRVMIQGVAVIPEDDILLILGLSAEQDLRLYTFSIAGARIAVSEVINQDLFNQQGAGSIEWASNHHGAELWVHGRDNLFQLEIDQGNWNVIGRRQFISIDDNPFIQDGIAFDGENIWLGFGPEGIGRIIDDGNRELQWLSVTPLQGEVQTNENSIVELIFDSRRERPGRYEAVLHLICNDPDRNSVDIPVEMTVESGPYIEVEWPEEAGFGLEQNSIDWNLFYESNIFTDTPYEIPLTIRNEGFNELTVESIEIESDYFSIDSAQFSLDPNQSCDVTIRFQCEEPGDYESSLIIVSNDPNQQEIEINLRASAGDRPCIEVEPMRIHVNMRSYEIDEQIVNVYNSGNVNLELTARIELLENNIRRDDSTERQLRTVESRQSNLGPKRDLSEGKFLLYQDVMALGWMNEYVFQRIEDVDYDFINNPEDLQDIDLNEYDALWIAAASQTEDFRTWWQEHLAEIEDYVAAGHSIYMEQGGIEQDDAVAAPGGLTYSMEMQDGILAVSGEDNWLAAQMGWEEGQFFVGNRWYNFTGVSYSVDNLENLENSTGYQIISIGARNRVPTIVQYNYGFGTVIAAGVFVGRQWYLYNVDGQWGSCGEQLLEYLLRLSVGLPWVTINMSEDVLLPTGDRDIVVAINSDDLMPGLHQAILHLESNDPHNPHLEVNIEAEITGVPVPNVVWDEDLGYPDIIDWNRAYEEVFVGRYPVTVSVINEGTGALHLSQIECDNISYFAEWDEVEQATIESGAQTEINLVLQAQASGDYEGIFTFSFTDEGIEPVQIACVGRVLPSPDLIVQPDFIAADLSTGESAEYEVIISNPGESALVWQIEGVIDEQLDEMDRHRSLRTAEGVSVPLRDNPGDVLGTFRLPFGSDGDYRGGYAWDYEHRWMWISQMRAGGQQSIIGAVDPNDNYRQVARFFGPINSNDMCWYNGILYSLAIGQWRIYRWDQEGRNLGDIVLDQNQFFPIGIDVSREQGLFFAVEGWPANQTRPIRVFRINQEGRLGDQIGVIEGCHDQILNVNARNHAYKNITWVDAHGEGQLWTQTGGEGGLIAWQFQIDMETFDPELAQHFFTVRNGGTDIDGFGHDGRNLWSSSWIRAEISIIDDGINEFGWLTFAPEAGETAPGEESVITVTLDASGLETGIYQGRLLIFSNDPFELDQADGVVEISLEVAGQGNIQVEPGGPDSEPLDFEIAYFGYPVSRIVRVSNSGSEDLVLHAIEVDQDNPDFFVREEDLEDFIVARDESRELTVWYDPNSERGGVQEATLMLLSNDGNWEDGYPLSCIVSIGAMEAPALELNQDSLSFRLGEDCIEEAEVELDNTGGSSLYFETEVIMVNEPERDESVRSRSLRSAQGSKSTPLRDDPQGRGLLMQNSCWWYQYDYQQYFDAIEGLDFERCRDWVEFNERGIDLANYDFIWFGNFESDEWIRRYNEHLDLVEEFVDNGGAIYFSAGSELDNVRPIFPGGLVYTGNQMRRQTSLPIVQDPEDNFFIDYMNRNDPFNWEWHAGQRLTGIGELSPVAFGYFRTEDIQNIENSDWYEVMVMGNEIEEPVVLTYRYGYGYCFVSTTLDGLLHRWNRTAQWGRTGEAVIWYLDHLSAKIPVIRLSPHRGEIAANSSRAIILTANSHELNSGEYELEIHFRSNDPENPDCILDVNLVIAGEPVFESDPIAEPLEGASVVEFGERCWSGSQYALPVTIRNTGSVDLILGDSRAEDPDNWSMIIPEDQHQIQPQQSITAQLVFHPIDIGNYASSVHLATNSTNAPNGEFWWNVNGRAILSPEIALTLPEERDSIALVVSPEENPIEYTFEVANNPGESRDVLNFSIRFEEGEEDRQIRAVTGFDDGHRRGAIPQRDAGGDEEARFFSPIQVTMGMTFDGENIWGCDGQAHRAVAISKETHAFVKSFEIHNNAIGITFDGENFWIGQSNSRLIFIYDLDGNQVEQFEIESDRVTGMASDRERYVFIRTDWDNRIHVYQIDNHEEVASINPMPGFLNNRSIGGIEWVPDHTGGQLWGLNFNYLFQAFVDENWETSPVQHFAVRDVYIYGGPAHDGRDFWVGNFQNGWKIYDDGVVEGMPVWMSLEPYEGELGAGETMEITLSIDPATLDDSLVIRKSMQIESNDPVNPVVEVPVHIRTGAPPLRHFLPDDPDTGEREGWIENDLSHTVSIEVITIGDEPASLGCEAGVFTPAGISAGGAVWLNRGAVRMRSFGDNHDIEDTTGFFTGERLCFRVWDDLSDQEYPAFVDIINGPETWADGGETSVALVVDLTRVIALELQTYWNMVSINVDPTEFYREGEDRGPDVEVMFGSLLGENEQRRILLVKDGLGRFWIPSQDYNNIPFWSLGEAYQIKMTEATRVEITGIAIPAQSPIPLRAGWNLSAYYPTYPLAADRPEYLALSGIIDHVIIAKDREGRFMSPQFGFSNMIPWCEGSGYQIKVDQAVTLNYPLEQNIAASLAFDPELSTKSRWADVPSTGLNMSVLISNVSGVELSTADQVAAFNAVGRLVGIGNVVDGMIGLAVWGDDPSTEAVDGLRENEAFSLKLWDSVKGEVVNLGVSTLLAGAGLVYTTDGFTVIAAVVRTALPTEFYLGQNYPNPFNAVTRVAFGLPEASRVTIRLFDVAGREVSTLINAELQAGHHNVVLNGESLVTGVYIVKMEAANFSFTRKLLLVK